MTSEGHFVRPFGGIFHDFRVIFVTLWGHLNDFGLSFCQFGGVLFFTLGCHLYDFGGAFL